AAQRDAGNEIAPEAVDEIAHGRFAPSSGRSSSGKANGSKADSRLARCRPHEYAHQTIPAKVAMDTTVMIPTMYTMMSVPLPRGRLGRLLPGLFGLGLARLAQPHAQALQVGHQRVFLGLAGDGLRRRLDLGVA